MSRCLPSGLARSSCTLGAVGRAKARLRRAHHAAPCSRWWARFQTGQESYSYAAALKRKQMIAEFRTNLAERPLMEALARPIAGVMARKTRKIARSAARRAKNATNPSNPRMLITRARL